MPFRAQLVAWPGAVLLSAAILAGQCIRAASGFAKTRTGPVVTDDSESDDPALEPSLPGTRVPVGYSLAQLATRTALVVVSVLGWAREGSSGPVEVAALAYVLVLDLARVLFAHHTAQLRSSLLHHVNVLVVVEVAVASAQLSPRLVDLHPRDPAPVGLWLALKLAAALIALAVAAASPRQWTPPPLSFGLAQRERPEPSPEQTSSYFSYVLSYSWLSHIVYRAWAHKLHLRDTLPLPEYDEPLVWLARVQAARRRFRTTAKTLAYTLRFNIATMVGCAALTAVVEFISPLALYCLLNYIQDPGSATVRPWVWVALLFVGPVLRSASYQRYIFNSTRLIVRIRLCLIQELFAKAGRCYDADATSTPAEKTQPGKSKSGTGQPAKSDNVTTLMAYDVDAICNSRDLFLVSTSSPIEITVGLVFLYILVGPYSLVALAVLLLSFPLATGLSRLMSRFQRALMARTDVRVACIAEYLSSIRTIKYLGWEPIMADRINQERRHEETQTWRRNLTAVTVTVLGDFVPLLALFAMFMAYTLVGHHELTAAKAFTSVTIIETLRMQFVWMANATRFITQARVAFARIDKFMVGAQEVQPHPSGGPPAFCQAVFRRALAPDSFRLRVDCDFVEHGLNVIAGPSGTGKSTLLLSLLGETVLEAGHARCPQPASYAPQIPWLLNDTVRANILMYQAYDELRYNRVIHACALLPDLAQLAEGDLAEVGVDGSNLSGGQRQRVGLARALYARSAVLVLDDVFSALDASTQKHIWDHAFCSEAVLHGRTVILVSQFQAAKNEADLLLELSHGQISSLTRSGRPRPMVPETADDLARVSSHVSGSWDPSKSENPNFHHARAIEQKIDQEVAGQGRNPRSLFYVYMRLFGGHGYAVLSFLVSFLLQLSFFVLPLWLAIWVGHSSSAHTDDQQPQRSIDAFYGGIYGGLLLLFLLLSLSNHVNLQRGAWKAAHRMHEKLVGAAMGVSVGWYDKNPPGRFINRFSSDIYSMDCLVIDYLRAAMDNAFRFLLRLAAIGSIMPVFALPAAMICSVGLLFAEMYTRAQLPVKALSAAAKSPIFTFFVESMAGRAVLRAGPGFQAAFADDLARRLRVYARADETRFNLNRWICVRADACSAIIALATGTIAVTYAADLSAGRLGFSLTSAIGLGQTILMLMRSMNDLEAELNCFHRVQEYASLPVEAYYDQDTTENTEDAVVPAHWPATGEVQFRDVTVRYALDGPAIIRHVNLTVTPGERVAIVGRTGSGKSTLALTLLGFTHITGGSLRIDGVDLARVPPHVLRRRLTIIPQEPVLFGGDVRFNLDPARSYPRERLTEAIGACSVLESLSGGVAPAPGAADDTADEEQPLLPPVQPLRTLDLDTAVAPQGSNFSVGQRQVLSLARATVRRSQVVILDEATASIDYQSDQAIQAVLRSAFRGRTVIAIVHRLSTIMDYDRVIVMDSGAVREIGSPAELCRKGGLFREMVRKSVEHGKGSEWTPEKLRKLEME